MKNKGFTLIELSLVIIIIGLLIAGISAGSSLINSTKLYSVINDYLRYQSAYNNFVARYSQPPGDFTEGYSYWGTNCTTIGTLGCNGNGNGIIDNLEPVFAWKHLSLAGMINEPIAVIADVANYNVIPGVSIPASKILGNGYSLSVGSTSIMFLAGTNGGRNGNFWPNNDTNIFAIGKPANITNDIVGFSGLLPSDASYIDLKIDDGIPYSGNVRSIDGSDVAQGSCLTDTITGNYNLLSTGIACITGFSTN